jgi:hypothetical protein
MIAARPPRALERPLPTFIVTSYADFLLRRTAAITRNLQLNNREIEVTALI